MIGLDIAKEHMSEKDYKKFEALYNEALSVPHLSRLWFSIREEMFEDYIMKYGLDDGNPFDLGNTPDVNFLGKVTVLLIEDNITKNDDFKISTIKLTDNEYKLPEFPIKYHKETEIEALKRIAKEYLGIEVITYELLNIDKGYSEDFNDHVPLNYIYIVKKFKRIEERDNIISLSFKEVYRECMQISRNLFHNKIVEKSKLNFNLSDNDINLFKRVFIYTIITLILMKV